MAKRFSTSQKSCVLASMLFAGAISCKDPDPSHRSVGSTATGANAGSANCLTAVDEQFDLTTNTSWNSGIGTIFTNSCGSCHPGSQTTDYKTYASVKANLASVLTYIQNGKMPKSAPMPQADQTAIAAWAAAGALEYDSGTSPVVSVSPGASSEPSTDTSGTGTSTSPCYNPTQDSTAGGSVSPDASISGAPTASISPSVTP